MIPNDWQTCTVEDCCEILDSRRIPLNQAQRRERKGDIPYWGANGILDYVDDYLFDEPLILMAEDGGYFEDAKNRPICNLIDGQSWVNNHAHVLRTKSGVLREWVYFYFVHRDITHYINGGTRSKLNQSDLRKLPLALPKFSEQKKIAAILSSVDDAIHATQAVIDQTHRVKQGLMQQLLTRGIGHTQFRQTEIGEIPIDWNISTIGQVCKVTSGGTPSRNQPEFWNGNVPWVKTGEINYSKILDTSEKITKDGILNSSAKLVPNGSLLMAMYGQGKTRGKVALLGIDATINQACLAILQGKYLCNEFLYHFLTREYINLRSLSHEGSQKNLNAALVKQVKIPMPCISEQNQIIKILNSVDSRISVENLTLVSYKNLKRGLMQDLLTGRVRVGGSI